MVEGSIKTYLKEIIEGAFYKKNRIEETMNIHLEKYNFYSKVLNDKTRNEN